MLEVKHPLIAALNAWGILSSYHTYLAQKVLLRGTYISHPKTPETLSIQMQSLAESPISAQYKHSPFHYLHKLHGHLVSVFCKIWWQTRKTAQVYQRLNCNKEQAKRSRVRTNHNISDNLVKKNFVDAEAVSLISRKAHFPIFWTSRTTVKTEVKCMRRAFECLSILGSSLKGKRSCQWYRLICLATGISALV